MKFRKLACDASRLGFSARDALRTAVALDASGEIVTGMSGSTAGVTTGAMPTGSSTTVSQPSGTTPANATGYGNRGDAKTKDDVAHVSGANDPWSRGYVHGKAGKAPVSSHPQYTSGHAYGQKMAAAKTK